VTVTHTEPFHISKAIATLDYISGGRAGVRVQISARPFEAELFGRRSIALDGTPEAPGSRGVVEDLFEEAGDYIEVLRRLWDSWEDDAEIRDVSTGRFVDRTKLHKIDFSGRWFSVKGPSITPRPPQGQPIVTALAHSELPYRFALSHADVVFVTPADAEEAGYLVGELDRLRSTLAEPSEHKTPIEHTAVLTDLVVFLGATAGEAESAKARMDERLGQLYRSDAAVFVGTAGALADLLEQWGDRGIEGFRLRPGRLPEDLRLISEDLVPELERRSLLRPGPGHEGGTLRDRFGLARPANRYVGVGAR
jgi:alkanesulfonate monooxygenase SsuD/methylene tetrahydromethanopterin reductase-like flavin-dependent oxidoreductase (luciferase family)